MQNTTGRYMMSPSSQREATIEDQHPPELSQQKPRLLSGDAIDSSKRTSTSKPEEPDGSEAADSEVTVSPRSSPQSLANDENSLKSDSSMPHRSPSYAGMDTDSSNSEDRIEPMASSSSSNDNEIPLDNMPQSSPENAARKMAVSQSETYDELASNVRTNITGAPPFRDEQQAGVRPSAVGMMGQLVQRAAMPTAMDESFSPHIAGSNSVQSMAASSHSNSTARSSPCETAPLRSILPLPSEASRTKLSKTQKAKSSRAHSSIKPPNNNNTAGLTPIAPTRATAQLSTAATLHGSSTKSKSSSGLRRGKWTVEEEAYVARVINDFNSGFLNAPAGTTLRSYLSDKLHCDPMRITKKFTGESCIGKRVFHPAVRCAGNAAAIDKAQAELDALERRWRRRLEMQQRESAKKAAASAAAAAAAAASGRPHLTGHGHNNQASTSKVTALNHSVAQVPSSGQMNQHAVARTASWLDRANAVLAGKNNTSLSLSTPGAVTTQDSRKGADSLPPSVIEDQMKQVQQLIHEGPIIQQTTAGLPHILDSGTPFHGRKVTDDPISSAVGCHAPVDKRPRTDSIASTGEEEDAEALVGFLNSVRASAAASNSERSG